MGPKKTSAAGATAKGKKKAADASSGASKRHRAATDPYRFRTAECQDFYESNIKGRNIIPERGVDVPTLVFFDSLAATVERRRWRTLLTFPTHSSSAICKEFYSNADRETVAVTRKSWVRKIDVPFDAATIEGFLQTSYDPSLDCEFVNFYNRMQPGEDRRYRAEMPDLADMFRRSVTSPYSSWKSKPGQSNLPEKLNRLDLIQDAIFWHAFVNCTVMPSTNKSDVNVERAILYHVIMGQGNLNIARILSDRILHLMLHGGSRFLLAHSSLITQLCVLAGVQIPEDEPTDVKVLSPISHNHIRALHNESSKQAIWLEQQQEEDSSQSGSPPPHQPSTAPSSSFQRSEHIPVYEDSPSYLHLQSQMTYSVQMMEHWMQHMGLHTADYRPQFPYPPPASTAPPVPAPTAHEDDDDDTMGDD